MFSPLPQPVSPGAQTARVPVRTITAPQTPSASRRALLLKTMRTSTVRMLDQVALTLALFATVLSDYAQQNHLTVGGFLGLRVSLRNLLVELAFLICWRLMFWAAGLYSRLIPRFAKVLLRVPIAVVPCTIPLLPALLIHHSEAAVLRPCFIFWFTGTTLMVINRLALFTYQEHIRPMLRRRRTVVICGTGLRAKALALELASHPDFCYQLLGFIDSVPQGPCDRLAPYLGGVEQMEHVLMQLPVDEVMVAMPVRSHFNIIEEIVNICARAGVQIQYSLDIFSTEIVKNRVVDSADSNRVVLQMVNQDHRLFLKGFVDRTLAGLGLLFLSPFLLLVALIVKLSSPGPVFFVQRRYGLNKRMFGMVKFRSMVTDAEAQQQKLEHLNEMAGPTFKMKNDPRITRIGAFIRRTSIDELPQLFNVLRGDMSLVGPRPLPMRDVQRFSEAWLMRRFSVKPGITGLWQVSGRSGVDFDQAIKLDLRYIDKWSLAMDFKIMARTFSAVIKGSGAY